ncbi:LysR family transcriptional regulator [Phaeovulum sp. W22_SRMD_FR3]|uniref:LysR family transcriptional regulator n=1 Tax=Phaeovulum sp. W22_SRMD_FR3 TaxID=3240274 RepID=UPI003F9B7E55
MSKMNVNHFDLNLLRVFLAIWDQRSVTGAAERLNLTQPAISHALRRLREQFSDPLFLRVGQKMEPTEAAKRLHEPFSRALRVVHQTMHDHEDFRPAESERSFVIAMSDMAEFYHLPHLVAYLERVAPNLRLRSVQLEAATISSQLRSGQVDIALGYLPGLGAPEVDGQHLMFDRFVCLLAAGHPLAGKVLTPDDFPRLRFVDVALHATGYKTIEAGLQELGVRRNAAVILEHFTIVPEVVRNSSCVALFPYSASLRVNEGGAFSLAELPFDLPQIEICLFLHTNFLADPGLRWMRQAMAEALGPLSPPGMSRA